MRIYCFAIRNVPEIIRLRGDRIEKPEIIGGDRYFVKRTAAGVGSIGLVGWVEEKNVEAFWVEESE